MLLWENNTRTTYDCGPYVHCNLHFLYSIIQKRRCVCMSKIERGIQHTVRTVLHQKPSILERVKTRIEQGDVNDQSRGLIIEPTVLIYFLCECQKIVLPIKIESQAKSRKVVLVCYDTWQTHRSVVETWFVECPSIREGTSRGSTYVWWIRTVQRRRVGSGATTERCETIFFPVRSCTIPIVCVHTRFRRTVLIQLRSQLSNCKFWCYNSVEISIRFLKKIKGILIGYARCECAVPVCSSARHEVKFKIVFECSFREISLWSKLSDRNCDTFS